MDTWKQTTRIALGLASILFGIAILLVILNMRGILMRVGVSGSINIMDVLVLAGLVLPPVIVGLHTLIARPRRDPSLNDKVHRIIAGVQFVSIATHLYASFVNDSGLSLGLIVALCVIGGASLFVIRKAPGGIIAAHGAQAVVSRD